jgi:hypothetical protein
MGHSSSSGLQKDSVRFLKRAGCSSERPVQECNPISDGERATSPSFTSARARGRRPALPDRPTGLDNLLAAPRESGGLRRCCVPTRRCQLLRSSCCRWWVCSAMDGGRGAGARLLAAGRACRPARRRPDGGQLRREVDAHGRGPGVESPCSTRLSGCWTRPSTSAPAERPERNGALSACRGGRSRWRHRCRVG